MSKTLITAVLDTEDHRFYLHGGLRHPLDHPGPGRGFVRRRTPGRLDDHPAAGQAAYLTSQRTLSRKIKEAVLADRLEQQVHQGPDPPGLPEHHLPRQRGLRGARRRPTTYFNEHASQLTLAQAALLAGLIQNPSGYDPILPTGRRRATRRRRCSPGWCTTAT